MQESGEDGGITAVCNQPGCAEPIAISRHVAVRKVSVANDETCKDNLLLTVAPVRRLPLAERDQFFARVKTVEKLLH